MILAILAAGSVGAADVAKLDWLAGTWVQERDGGAVREMWLPPRDGAMDICKALPESGAPARILYVSCSPSTLARDAGVLVNVKGYRLSCAGVVNMFPHTSHVESMAVLDPPTAT